MKNLFQKIIIVAITFFSFTFTSCKKDAPVADTKSLLVDVKWKIIAGTSDGVDVFSTSENCVKDDLTIFNSNGKVVHDNGAIKCTITEEQQKEIHKWTLSDDSKSIKIFRLSGSFDTEIKILEISSTKLRIESIDEDDNLLNVTYEKIK